jgi:hypothetical protein
MRGLLGDDGEAEEELIFSYTNFRIKQHKQRLLR